MIRRPRTSDAAEEEEYPRWIQHALDNREITLGDALLLCRKALPLRHGSPLQLIGKGSRGHVSCTCRFTLRHSCTKLPPLLRMSL